LSYLTEAKQQPGLISFALSGVGFSQIKLVLIAKQVFPDVPGPESAIVGDK